MNARFFPRIKGRSDRDVRLGLEKQHAAVAGAEFFAISGPSSEDFNLLENLVPGNPFYTAGFAKSRSSLGAEPWMLGLCANGKIVSACTAFLRRGRINRRLQIFSIPESDHLNLFWEGLVALCRRTGISVVDAGSFCSTNGTVPNLSGETNRRQRWEFVMDLREKDLEQGLQRTHRANIRKARNAGVEIRRTTDAVACETHLKLILESRKRRIDRGEMMEAISNSQEHRMYLHYGVGELFQAVQGGDVISSNLVLKSAQGAYTQSAGTSPRGMNCHASHLLIFEMAQVFQRESKLALNLGGVDNLTSGLAKFKANFKAKVIGLQSAEFFFGNVLQRKMSEVAALWQSYRHAS